MKKIILINALFLSLSALAQTADTVNGTANDVFYNLKTSAEHKVDINSWDIGFTTAGFDASIIANESKGVEVYVYSSDTNDWSSVDTTAFDFESNILYNSTESWEVGAFTNQGVVHPDYGWGLYNGSNHDINGNRIFIVKHGTKYSQFQVVSLTAAGVFTVKFGDIGGSNSEYLSFSKSTYNSKNFVYCSLDSRTLVNTEANAEDWHLLFTKYMEGIQAGPDFVYYPVSGVKINKNLQVAERRNVTVTDSDTNGLVWNDNITEIGYDWKTFNNGTFSYDITADLSYFVKNEDNEVWKIWFTDYGSGTYYFNVEQIASTVSIDKFKQLKSTVYPSPANESLSVINREEHEVELNILNISGQSVLEDNLLAGQNKQLDISLLSPGIYYVRISGENKFITHKVVVY